MAALTHTHTGIKDVCTVPVATPRLTITDLILRLRMWTRQSSRGRTLAVNSNRTWSFYTLCIPKWPVNVLCACIGGNDQTAPTHKHHKKSQIAVVYLHAPTT